MINQCPALLPPPLLLSLVHFVSWQEGEPNSARIHGYSLGHLAMEMMTQLYDHKFVTITRCTTLYPGGKALLELKLFLSFSWSWKNSDLFLLSWIRHGTTAGPLTAQLYKNEMNVH